MKTITILTLLFFNLLTPKVKRDYISFECIDMHRVSKNVIYLSKGLIPGPEQVGSFDYSPSPLNYVISGQGFSFIENIISSTSKKTFQEKDSIGVIERDSIGIVVKIRKNNTVIAYFITIANAKSMFENIVSYLEKRKGDPDLIIDLNSLNWSNQVTNGIKNDYIAIEYAGDADKPMRSIWISKKPIPDSEMIMIIEYDDFGPDYIVHNDEYLFIKKLIISKKTFAKRHYNGFEITIRENNIYTHYFIKRKNSYSLFLKSNSYLKYRKRNKDLIYELNRSILANDFDDSGHYTKEYQKRMHMVITPVVKSAGSADPQFSH